MKSRGTRIRGPQSKHGCFTCKARRIKCDEERPTCLRCARSMRVCEGYRETERSGTPVAHSPGQNTTLSSHQSHQNLIISHPTCTLRTGCAQSQQQRRLSQLGARLLRFDSFGSFGASGVVLDFLIPQLCHTMPSVNVMAVALGAAYQAQCASPSSLTFDKAFVAIQYQRSLRAMRRDLAAQQHGQVPLMISCTMLALTELFLRHEENALIHLHCAFKLLQDRKDTRMASSRFDGAWFGEDDIEIVFRTLDFHTCSYALSKTPYIPAIPPPSVLPLTINLDTASTTLVQVVHHSYHFTSIAYRWKYHPAVDPTMYIQQGKHIALLLTWLELFNHTILSPLEEITDPSRIVSYSHALTLRMTALSTLIHLSCILSQLETSYDAHESHFQQIITDGEAILAARHKAFGASTNDPDSPRFTNGPGLIQPLFQCALKSRHPLHRRRAIALLPLAGREGPWCGPREACITSRIMELEEHEARAMSPESADLTNIPEPARINTMGMEPVKHSAPPSNQVIARLFRCKDMQACLSYPCGHGHGQNSEKVLHFLGAPCPDNPHWEMWEEVLTF